METLDENLKNNENKEKEESIVEKTEEKKVKKK